MHLHLNYTTWILEKSGNNCKNIVFSISETKPIGLQANQT